MKTGREHRVPLSVRAVDILEQARAMSDGSGYIFPSLTGRAMSDSTISKLLRENGIGCVRMACDPRSGIGRPNARMHPGKSVSWPWHTSTVTGWKRPIGELIYSLGGER